MAGVTAFIRDDVVHKGCGGKIRERANPHEEATKKERLDELFVTGAIDMERYESLMAKLLRGKPDTQRQLECLYCGAEASLSGMDDKEEREVISTVPADTYHGRILGDV